MSLYLRLGSYLLLAVLAFGVGWKVCNWRHDSLQLAVTQAAEKAGEAAAVNIVGAIQALRPKYTTIRNEVQRETRIEPRYVAAECQHTDAVWVQISAAYEALGYPPLSGVGLPKPSPASGPDTGGNN